MKIPFAVQYGKMRERGNYPDGAAAGPRGAVVHFTAGRFLGGLSKAKSSIDGGIKNGYTFLCIAYTGEIVQAHDILKWGSHAGESAWNVKLDRLTWKLQGTVSDDLIGIEMNNAGKLTPVKFKDGETKYYPYWCFKDGDNSKALIDKNGFIPAGDVRFVQEKDYGCPTGYYHKYTPEQEETLTKTLLWLYKNCPAFKLEYVLGHHEVAGKLGIGRFRKNDPGGALSMTMDKYRHYLITNRLTLNAKYGI